MCTDRSSLLLHAMDDAWTELVDACVQETLPLLTVNPPLVMYGKPCTQHRSIGFFSDAASGYQYSSYTAASHPLTPALARLLAAVNARLEGARFNGVLVNRYADGSDYIGRHADNEKELDPGAGVIAAHWGASRTFRIRDLHSRKIVVDVPTCSRQLIQMAGAFQTEFTHEVPVQKRIAAPRVSFTFRTHRVVN